MYKCLFCSHRQTNPADQCKPIFVQSYSCDAGQVNNKECQYFKSDMVVDVNWTEVKPDAVVEENKK